MSIKLMTQVWERELDKAEQSILLAMADHADDFGNHCFPSIELIAWKTGYSERQVKRIIKTLRERGVLVLVRPAGRGRANEYRIDLSRTSPKPPFSPQKGDTMSPVSVKGDTMSPQNDAEKGDICDIKGDISSTKGDTAMSPEPMNHIEPIEPREREGASAPPFPPPSSPVDVDFMEGSNASEPEPEPPRKPGQKMYAAICDVLGWDRKIIAEEDKVRVAEVVVDLSKANYTVEDIQRFMPEVWFYDWRWEKNQTRPTLTQLRQEIGKLRATPPVSSRKDNHHASNSGRNGAHSPSSGSYQPPEAAPFTQDEWREWLANRPPEEIPPY